MVNKKRKQISGLENIAIIATHHNVLKKLFPLKKLSSGQKYGYANCCCLKVKWEGNNLTVTCYFQGFPEETIKSENLIKKISVEEAVEFLCA